MSLDAFVFCPGGDDTSNPQHVKVRVHLGNLAAIGYLRDRVAKALPPTSIVLGKVCIQARTQGTPLMPVICRPSNENFRRLDRTPTTACRPSFEI